MSLGFSQFVFWAIIIAIFAVVFYLIKKLIDKLH